MSTNEAAAGIPTRVGVPAFLPAFWRAPVFDRVLAIIGRIGIVYLFGNAAMFHLTKGWDMTIANMTARNIPAPEILNVIAMLVSGGLALLLLFNVRPRWSALGLALYTLVVSSVMYTPSVGVSPQILVLFMKDMAIFGALLALSAALASNARLAAEIDAMR